MEKNANKQLELFDKVKENSCANASGTNPILAYLKIYEKFILSAIGLIVVAMVSFFAGIERGRNAPLPAAAPLAPQQATQPLAAPQSNSSYIIKLATYKTPANAKKAAEALKKKGLATFIFFKDGYAVLYVGNYANQSSAQAALTELKKVYPDCKIMIRRM